MPQMANRVQETTTTGGTGTITLGGAVTGYLTFASSFATSSVLFYTIDNGVGEWEIGIGTLVTTGTLSRTTVIASSNGGALVNFGSGTKRVFCSAPTRSLVPDQDSKSGYVLTTDGTSPAWTQTLNSITIGNTTPAAGAFTTLSASSTVSGTGFSTYLASPPAIGGTAPAAGSFTNLSYTGTLTGSTGVLNIGSGQIYKNASGNVGIGITPQYKFHILQGSSVGANYQLAIAPQDGALGRDSAIRFGSTFSNGWGGSDFAARYSGGIQYGASGGGANPRDWSMRFLVGDNSDVPTERLRIDSSGTLLLRQSSNAANTSVSFNTTVQNALTLDANGNLNLGITGRPERLAVFGNSGPQALCLLFGNTAGDVGNSALVISKYDNNTTTSQVFVRFFVNALGAACGQINANGANTAAFGTYSDSRLKENITSLPSQLANIIALNPCEFDYKDGSGHQIGFIAQEMEEVYPDVVGEREDGMKTITGWSKTEARLVKAIQELHAEIETLKQRIN